MTYDRLPIHPRTGLTALGIIGGRPVWPVLGGSQPAGDPAGGDAGAANNGGDAPGGAAPADGGGAANGGQGAPSGGDGAGAGNGGSGAAGAGDGGAAAGPADKYANWTPAQLADALEKARAESVKARTDAKQTAADEARQALAQDIGKALGLVKDDAPMDPVQLQKSLEAERGKGREAVLDLAVFRGAGRKSANAERLLDSRSFAASVAKLDPNADGFQSQLDAAIDAAVKNDPSLKVTGSIPAAGSADMSGGSGDNGASGSNSVDAMRKRLRAERT